MPIASYLFTLRCRRRPLIAKDCCPMVMPCMGHPRPTAMMRNVSLERTPVSTFATLQKPGDPCHRCRTCPCCFCNVPVGLPCRDLLCDLKSLAPCLQLGESANVPQEVCHLGSAFAGSQCLTERFEPRVFPPIAFGECFTSHGHILVRIYYCVNVLSHWYISRLQIREKTLR